MKKLISVLLICLLTLSSFASLSFAYTDVSDSEHYKSIVLLSGLGVINGYEDGSFRPEEIATRAEFAVMISRFMNMGTIVSGEGKPYFTDVSGDSFAKGAISYCAEAGIMSGYGNGLFMPDKPVTFDEAVKTIINVLGYKFYAENEGEYPYGYRIEAKKIGLLSGLVSKNADAISRGEICTLMYNALKVPLIEIKEVGDKYTLSEDPSKTVLTEYFRMTMQKGIINSDGITKIEYVTGTDTDHIVFNDVLLEKNNMYNGDFLGKSVEVIYTLETNENPNLLISIAENQDRNNEIVIPAQDITRVNPDSIDYEPENADKEKTLNLSAARKVIYNGVFDFTYDLNRLTDLKNASVTFLDNDGDKKYDVLKINEAENYIVMNTVGEKLILRDITDGGKYLDLEQIENVEIYDQNGNLITEEEFGRKLVNIASVFRNGNYYAKIVVVNESVSGAVSYVENSDKGDVLGLDTNVEILLNKDYKTENGFKFTFGDSITAYLDINKTAYYIVYESATGYKPGYLMTVKGSVSFNDNMKLKLFTRENKIRTFEVGEKLKLNGVVLNVDKNENTIMTTLCADDEKLYSQFILYMLDQDGKVSEIYQCSEAVENPENKLFRFNLTTGGRFSTGTYSFGGIANTDSSTWLIRVPSGDASDAAEEDFATYRLDQLIAETYPIEFYVTSLDKQIADIVSFTGDNLPKSITYDDYLCVLLKRTRGVDAEGSVRTKLKYYSNGNEYEKFVGDYADSAALKQINQMEPGEVFSLVQDNNGEIMLTERYYSVTDGWINSLVDGKPQTNTYGATRRIVAYYVSHISGGYARCSFEPVISNSYDAQLLESVKLPGSNVFTLVRKSASGAVQVGKGSEKDINLLDTIVTRTRGGSDREIIIIKN